MASQLIRLSGLAFAVLMGCIYMLSAGAPREFWIINGAALACAIGLSVFLKRLDRGFGVVAFTGFALALFAATLFSDAEIDGIHRWIAVGPVRLHVGLLLLPATISLLPDLRRELALLTVIAISLIVSLQPDRASAFALLSGVFVLAIAKRDKWYVGMLAITVIGFSWTLSQIDPLQPVRFVEYVIRDAWEFHPSAAVILAVSLILALVMPLFGLNSRNQIPLIASLATIGGFVIISLFGPYPMPLIGYGVSAIVGYGLALGFSAVRETGA
ncbi:hypothetical protein [uncultured Parasphingorhabdus sp.]|uniref:hypothetical protein n=1 Tax=uncultured Parasphingorhabdus sp. TaxID=2709694 RepID=UPI0030D7E1C2|tara:strand:- start:7107 stop:7919 length:813 start_codon:yes stop_codon:yes gene_type:complete